MENFVKAVLFQLLDEDKNKDDNKKVGGSFVKPLNGCMLRILENSNANDMFQILFNILIEVQLQAKIY